MTADIDGTTWVYVLVQDPGSKENIIAQTDAEKKITFIPSFMAKETAEQALFHMPKERGRKYEIQAIIYEDLERYAEEGSSLIFILDSDGKILDKRAPGTGSLRS